MKTDTLIDVLATQLAPVQPRRALRRLALAAVAGFVLAVPLVLWRLGLNDRLPGELMLPSSWLKWGFVVWVTLAGGWATTRLARPGWRAGALPWSLGLALLLLWSAALWQLAHAESTEQMRLVLGSSWRTCTLNIALLSLPALVLLLVAVRSLAPTRPVLAGAAAGLFAGALATLAYLLHCPELAAPFIAIWYVLGMLVPAALGALFGRVLLRW